MSTNKAKAAWTDSEKYQILLKVISNIGGGDLAKVHVKFSDGDIPGRTARATSDMWARIKKDAVAGNSNGTAGPVTPRNNKKRPAPASGAKSRASNKKSSRAKKSKQEEWDSDEAEEDLDLGETSDEEVAKPSKIKVEAEEEEEEEEDE